MSSAYVNMKTNAVQASKDTAKLFECVIAYYNEKEYSVVIESELKQSLDLRAELDGMAGAINSAWFERFDAGVAGTVRALMDSHLGLLNNLYDRLRALMVAVSTEDFGDSHNKIMDKIRGSSMALAEAEKEHLKDLVADAKKAVKQLAVDFDGARRAFAVI